MGTEDFDFVSMKQKSLVKNSFYNLIKTFSGLLFPLITFSYSARILGEVGIGKINFAKSIVSYFIMIAMLGMNYYGTREAAKLRDNERKLSLFVREMLVINGCTTLFSYLLLTIVMLTVPKLQNYRELLVCCSLAIFLQGMGVEWLYQALEEYRYIALRSVLFQVIALIALFLFVRDEQDVLPYAMITLFASSGSYIINFINARKYICFCYDGHFEIRKHLKPLLWLFAMAVSIELYTVLDSTMLGFLQGDGAVGLYTAAIKVERIVNTMILSIGIVLMPRLSIYIDRDATNETIKLVKTAYNCIFMFSVPIAVGLFMLSDDVIRLFCGKQFASASLTMRIMTPIVILIPFSAMTNQHTFIPMGKEKLILISTCVGAVTNFILNSVLIPRYAQNGAAVGTVLAETAVAVVCMLNVQRYFDIKAIFKTIWQYFIAVLPIPLIVVWVSRWKLQYVIGMVLEITISAAAYFVILMLLRNPYIREAVTAIQGRFAKKRE